MLTSEIDSASVTPRSPTLSIREHDALTTQLLDIERITRLENGALRNLLITQRYHDLSHGIANVIGKENVNWSTFATWASYTAGQSIRGEIVPRLLRVVLEKEEAFERSVGKLRHKLFGRGGRGPETLFDMARDAVRGVQNQVAEGNLRVFAELAPMFARFSFTFAGVKQHDEDLFEGFVDAVRFRKGAPSDNDGQDLLKTAFRNYYESAWEMDPALKAQKILLANALIGLHEQTRLQPNIEGALDAPIREVVEARAIRGLPGFLPPPLRKPFESVARAVATPVVKIVTYIWEHLATETMMTLGLPGHRLLPLGRDVPTRAGGFPAHLRAISCPPLLELLETYDHTANTTRGSGASDWSHLPDRMHFIIDLFRMSQCDQPLYDQPYSEKQRVLFEAGFMPDGPF